MKKILLIIISLIGIACWGLIIHYFVVMNYIIIKREPGVYWQKVGPNYCLTEPWKEPMKFYVDENFEVLEGGGCSKDYAKRKNAIYEYLKYHKEHPTIWYGADHKGTNEWDMND